MPVRGLKAVVATAASAFKPVMGHGAGLYVRLTLTGNVTIGVPDSARIGQQLIFEYLQDGTGSRTVTYNAAYQAGTALATIPTSGNAAAKIITDQFVVSAGGSYGAPILRRDVAAPTAWA